MGDAAQTIYSFAGATDRFLRDFPRRFPGATQVRLVRDYRSTEPIVALANAILVEAGDEASRLVSQCGPGPEPEVRDFAIREIGCVVCIERGLGYVPCEKHHLLTTGRHGSGTEKVEIPGSDPLRDGSPQRSALHRYGRSA